MEPEYNTNLIEAAKIWLQQGRHDDLPNYDDKECCLEQFRKQIAVIAKSPSEISDIHAFEAPKIGQRIGEVLHQVEDGLNYEKLSREILSAKQTRLALCFNEAVNSEKVDFAHSTRSFEYILEKALYEIDLWLDKEKNDPILQSDENFMHYDENEKGYWYELNDLLNSQTSEFLASVTNLPKEEIVELVRNNFETEARNIWQNIKNKPDQDHRDWQERMFKLLSRVGHNVLEDEVYHLLEPGLTKKEFKEVSNAIFPASIDYETCLGWELPKADAA